MSSEAAVQGPKAKKKQKGRRIEVVGGKYIGKRGWINVAKGEKGFTDQKIHVILLVDNGNSEALSCIYQSSVIVYNDDTLLKEREDMSYVDVLLHDHKDISALVSKLASEIAKCQGLSVDHIYQINSIFNLRLQNAIALQHKRKHKAHWRLVNYKPKVLSTNLFDEWPVVEDRDRMSVQSSLTGNSRNSKKGKKKAKTASQKIAAAAALKAPPNAS